MRNNNIISILDVLLTETTLVTKANPDSVRIWDRDGTNPGLVESGTTTSGPGNAVAEPVVVATRLATAAAPVTARRRREANIERRLDATEQLRGEMREMRTLLESLVPSVAASTSQGASTSQQGAPRVSSPVASTSRQGVALIAIATVSSGLAPPRG